MMVYLSASFTVEEICARRCLYGRGGVLCNCNARHFTGKRSGLLPEDNIYIKDFMKPGLSSTYPQDKVSKENSDSYESSFLQDPDTLPQEYKLGADSGSLEDSWSRQKSESSLPKLSIKSDADIVGSIDNDENTKEDEKAKMTTKNNNGFHIILLQNDEDNDDVVDGARKKTVSYDKQRIANSHIADGNTAVSDDSAENIRVANDQKFVHKPAKTEESLAQLERILRRALYGR